MCVIICRYGASVLHIAALNGHHVVLEHILDRWLLDFNLQVANAVCVCMQLVACTYITRTLPPPPPSPTPSPPSLPPPVAAQDSMGAKSSRLSMVASAAHQA